MKIFQKISILVFSLAVLISCEKKEDKNPPDDNNDQQQKDDHSVNKKKVGASAHDLLSDDIYKELSIEVQYVEGMKPTDDAIQNLEHFLKKYLYKPGGIAIKKLQ